MRTRLRLLPLVLWLAGAPSPVAAAPPSPPAAGDAWKEVDRLVGERKLASAIDALGPLLTSARARHQDDDVARALLTRTRLRMQLGAWETAARELHDEPWPESFVPRLAVELYYAQALLAYLQRFAWQIRTRERVDGGGPLDLTLWTTDQIVAEAERAYQDAWSHRAALGDIPVAAFGAYLEPNDYPMGIRDTLRDALTYLVVDLLGDTALWTPAESSERFRLDARALATSALAGVRVDDTGRHPLERVCAALADLEAWHASQGGAKLGGALEARLVRLRVLREHADGEPQR